MSLFIWTRPFCTLCVFAVYGIFLFFLLGVCIYVGRKRLEKHNSIVEIIYPCIEIPSARRNSMNVLAGSFLSLGGQDKHSIKIQSVLGSSNSIKTSHISLSVPFS